MGFDLDVLCAEAAANLAVFIEEKTNDARILIHYEAERLKKANEYRWNKASMDLRGKPLTAK